MKGNQQQQGSAGLQLDFAPHAVEENGVMQRQLQAAPAMGAQQRGGPTPLQGLLASLQQAPSQQGGGLLAPMVEPDPNVNATMQGLQALFAESKAKKMAAAKAVGGGA